MEHVEHTFDSAGFESLMNNFEHVKKILTGFESIHEEIDYDGPLGDDIEYATTVLQLNDIDLPELAGQEGFMDNLKRAGTKIKDFIIELVRYIRNWFKPKEEDVKAVEDMFKQLRSKPTPEAILKAGQDQALKGTDEAPKAPSNVTAFSDYASFRKKKADQLRSNVRRLTPEERSAVSEAANQISDNADVKDKLVMVSTNIDARVNATVERTAKQILNAISEIERIDPNEETRTRLGFAIDSVKGTMSKVSQGNNDSIENVRYLIGARHTLSECKNKASANLEKMAKGTEEEDRILNRATSVTQELVKATEAACNGILSLDTVWRKTETSAIDEVTSSIFKRAKAITDSNISPALEELTRISLHGK